MSNTQQTLVRLARLREAWSPPAGDVLVRRRAHAAWCNAGIEGNRLPWDTWLRLVTSNSSQPQESAREGGDRPEREPLGCLRGLEFMEETGVDTRLTLALLRHLHGIVMADLGARAGQLRDREVRIVRESGPEVGRTVFAPPHASRVPELLEDLLARVETETALGEADGPLLAGRFHYEFQSIHPFADGNGRIGRLLSTWLLRRGWPAAGFYWSPAVKRAESGYYLALRAVRPDFESQTRDGLWPWLGPFLAMVEDALTHPESPGEGG